MGWRGEGVGWRGEEEWDEEGVGGMEGWNGGVGLYYYNLLT